MYRVCILCLCVVVLNEAFFFLKRKENHFKKIASTSASSGLCGPSGQAKNKKIETFIAFYSLPTHVIKPNPYPSHVNMNMNEEFCIQLFAFNFVLPIF